MPDERDSGLVEPEGVNAGPSVDEAEQTGDTSGPSAGADLDRRAGVIADGTGGGAELTTAGTDDAAGPGQELSAGEG